MLKVGILSAQFVKMKEQDFLERFASQFDDTDISEFSMETVFQELEEWSSLTMLGVISFIRTDYGKKVTATNIRSCNTIKDLYELIEKM